MSLLREQSANWLLRDDPLQVQPRCVTNAEIDDVARPESGDRRSGRDLHAIHELAGSIDDVVNHPPRWSPWWEWYAPTAAHHVANGIVLIGTAICRERGPLLLDGHLGRVDEAGLVVVR